jgi:hypothetical protein
VQSNFLMRDCGSLPLGNAVTINRSMTLGYEADGRRGRNR